MRLTEIIQVPYSEELSELCHLAKNLYNLANWYMRQDFFRLNNILNYYDLDFILKDKEAYRTLPSQTSQQILRYLSRDWKFYFRGLREYKKDYKRFKGKPRIPGYKKRDGEAIVIFTNQQCRIKEGKLHFPKKVNLEPIKTRMQNKLKEVRIIPLGCCYKIEIVYEKKALDLGLDKNNILAIDLGLNNLITAVNNIRKKPIIVKGKVLIQQIKYKSELVGIQFETDDESYTSKCSFLDNEEIKKHDKYLGTRIRRGLFRASNGTIINADVNAALKKVFPNSITVDGIEAFGLMSQIIQQNIVDLII